MRKFLTLATSLVLSASLTLGAGCSGGGGSSSGGTGEEKPEYLVGSELKKTDGGRTYLEVQGAPFLYTGVQIRADGYTQLDKRPLDEMKEQFRLASELGVKCVEVPVSWNELEPEEDVYNFKKIKTYLEWCKEYDLKLEVLWFAYNTGQSLEMYVPTYIFDDEERFPQHPSDVKGELWGEQGRVTFFIMNSPELLRRERKAIAQLTNFIYEWENQNGNPNVVISYQVHNEVDNYPRWNINSRNVLKADGSGEKLEQEEAWLEIYESLNSAGTAFKNSKYRAVTRCNLVALRNTDEWKNFAVRVFNLDGIDMVGDDTYTQSVAEQKLSMANLFSDKFYGGNFAHVAENSGSFKNSPTLIMSAITQGAGYLMYCLSMPMFWIQHESNWDWWEQGVLNVDWSDKEHTPRVRTAFAALKKAAEPLAVCEINDMASFNCETDFPQDDNEQTYSLGGIDFKMSTKGGGIGYCFVYSGNLYVYADKDFTVTLSDKRISAVLSGEFKGFNFSGNSVSASENTASLSGDSLYKIEII